jgi:hypothetical protein
MSAPEEAPQGVKTIADCFGHAALEGPSIRRSVGSRSGGEGMDVFLLSQREGEGEGPRRSQAGGMRLCGWTWTRP